MADPTRTVREQFLVEIGSGRELDDLTQLNTLFTAWVETVYHRRVHSETGQTPTGTLVGASPGTAVARAAARGVLVVGSAHRDQDRARSALHGNAYEVDAALVGRKVELVFDPFDLTSIQVRWQGRSMGHAVPHRIGRHVHPKARPDDTHPATRPDRDRLPALVAAQHTAELAQRVQYTQLPTSSRPTGTSPASSHRCPCTGDDDSGEGRR